MFDLGMQELVVIFVVALIVFGPKRLPELGRTLGKALGELKRSMSGIKDQINEEVKDLNVDVKTDLGEYIGHGPEDGVSGRQGKEGDHDANTAEEEKDING